MHTRVLPVLVGVSLLGNAVLGVLAWTQQQELQSMSGKLDVQLATAKAELNEATEDALSRVDTTALEGRVASVESDVRNLTGVMRTQQGIDRNQNRQRDLLRDCANDAFRDIEAYATRVAAWVGLITSGNTFAAKPSLYTPRCY